MMISELSISSRGHLRPYLQLTLLSNYDLPPFSIVSKYLWPDHKEDEGDIACTETYIIQSRVSIKTMISDTIQNVLEEIDSEESITQSESTREHDSVFESKEEDDEEDADVVMKVKWGDDKEGAGKIKNKLEDEGIKMNTSEEEGAGKMNDNEEEEDFEMKVNEGEEEESKRIFSTNSIEWGKFIKRNIFGLSTNSIDWGEYNAKR